MNKDNVISLKQLGEFEDQLTQILRQGAQALIAQAVEAEFAAFLESQADKKLENGHQRIVRHSHLPERCVATGIGSVPVKVPRSRDRQESGDESVKFSSQILPPYVRRSKSIEAALPYLYLKGISSGDFEPVMTALLGKEATGFSADTILRLRKTWQEDMDKWDQRRLESKNYVYMWADGVYLQARLEEEKQCLLVIIGATPEGKKELVGFTDGYRESAQNWRELLLDLKARGLTVAPKLAVGGWRFRFLESVRGDMA